jgi:hypothetical protein
MLYVLKRCQPAGNKKLNQKKTLTSLSLSGFRKRGRKKTPTSLSLSGFTLQNKQQCSRDHCTNSNAAKTNFNQIIGHKASKGKGSACHAEP